MTHAEVVVRVRRVYDGPEYSDGRRVLVDRLWPRGLAKSTAALHAWMRDVAPSRELRRWYGHDPARFAEFVARYRAELADATHAPAMAQLREYAAVGPITLLTAARDVAHAHAAILAEVLAEK